MHSSLAIVGTVPEGESGDADQGRTRCINERGRSVARGQVDSGLGKGAHCADHLLFGRAKA